MKKLILIFTLASLFLVHPLFAKIYKWVEENRKMQYSSTPPKHLKTEELKLAPFSKMTGQTNRKTYSQIKAEREKKQKDLNKQTPQQDEAKKNNLQLKKKNCAIAKKDLNQYKEAFTTNLLTKKDENGYDVLMDTNDVEKGKKAAQQKVREYCN